MNLYGWKDEPKTSVVPLFGGDLKAFRLNTTTGIIISLRMRTTEPLTSTVFCHTHSDWLHKHVLSKK